VDFLHHGICLDVEVGDDGVDVQRRIGCGLRGRERLDPEISFLAAAACSSSSSWQAAKTRRRAAVAFSSVATTSASSHYLKTPTSAVGRATMSDGMTTEGEGGVNSAAVL
jgi:hypothetical protein